MRRPVAAILSAGLLAGLGCNAILGIGSHTLADGGTEDGGGKDVAARDTGRDTARCAPPAAGDKACAQCLVGCPAAVAEVATDCTGYVACLDSCTCSLSSCEAQCAASSCRKTALTKVAEAVASCEMGACSTACGSGSGTGSGSGSGDAGSDARTPLDASMDAHHDAGVDASAAGYHWSEELAATTFNAVAVDSLGHTLVAGTQTMSSVGYPYFVQYNSGGTVAWERVGVVAGTALGGAVNPSNNVVFTGTVTGQGTLPGCSTAIQAGGFVVEYSPSGICNWSTSYPGTTVRAATWTGNAWLVIGTFSGTLNVPGASSQMAAGTGAATFMLALNPGGAPLFTQSLSSANGIVTPRALAAAAGAEAFVVGDFTGSVVANGETIIGPTPGGNATASYLVGLNEITGVYGVSATFHVTGSSDSLRGIAIDNMNQVYVVGDFTTSIDIGSTISASGGQSIVLAALNPALTTAWAKPFGNSANQTATGVTVDSAGEVVMTGTMVGSVDLGGGPRQGGAFGTAFAAAYTTTGSNAGAYVMDTLATATTSSSASAIAASGAPGVVFVGAFSGMMDLGPGPALASSGSGDAFVAWWVP